VIITKTISYKLLHTYWSSRLGTKMRSHGAPRCELLAQLGLPLGGSSNPRNGLALFLSNSVVADLSYVNVDDLAHGVVRSSNCCSWIFSDGPPGIV